MTYGYKHVAPLEQRIRNNQDDFSGKASSTFKLTSPDDYFSPSAPALPPDVRRRLRLAPAKVVLKTHDVVLAEISSSLHLDKDQIFVAGILDAVGAADRNVD